MAVACVLPQPWFYDIQECWCVCRACVRVRHVIGPTHVHTKAQDSSPSLHTYTPRTNDKIPPPPPLFSRFPSTRTHTYTRTTLTQARVPAADGAGSGRLVLHVPGKHMYLKCIYIRVCIHMDTVCSNIERVCMRACGRRRRRQGVDHHAPPPYVRCQSTPGVRFLNTSIGPTTAGRVPAPLGLPVHRHPPERLLGDVRAPPGHRRPHPLFLALLVSKREFWGG